MLHERAIEAREYARHEARRGRRHAFEYVDPTRTALVVIDMVPFFLDANVYARGIVDNIARLAEALRNACGTVAWVVLEPASPTPIAVELHTIYRSFGDVRSTDECTDLITSSLGEGASEERSVLFTFSRS